MPAPSATERPARRRRSRRPAAAIAAGSILAALAVAGLFRLAPRSVRHVGGDRLRVALCQYDCRPNAWRWNREHALRYAQEAADNGAGVVILPEYSFCTAADALTGLAFPRLRRAMKRFGARLSRFCRRNRCYLFANVPWEAPGGDPMDPDRRNRTLVYAPDGRIAAVYDKRNVAFLDALGLVKGGARADGPFDLEFGRVGTMICRDASYPRQFKSYRDADLIVVQFAHVVDWTSSTNDPGWLINDMGTVEDDFPRIGERIARTLNRPAVFANKTGLEPEGAFAGGSCAISDEGEVVARAGFGGDVLYVDFDLDENGRIIPSIPPVPWTPGKGL